MQLVLGPNTDTSLRAVTRGPRCRRGCSERSSLACARAAHLVGPVGAVSRAADTAGAGVFRGVLCTCVQVSTADPREDWSAMDATLRLRFYNKKVVELRSSIQASPPASP